jgi:hypothetical protein
MNWLNVITELLNPVNEVVKTTFGSREMRDQAAASENAAAMQEYAAEFVARAQRTWFDSLVDGLNRLQRPTYTFSTLGLFWLAYKNPKDFAQIMLSIALIPEQFWIIIGMIVGFLFSSRMIEKLPVAQGFKPLDDKQINRIRDVAKELPQAIENPSIEAWKASRK